MTDLLQSRVEQMVEVDPGNDDAHNMRRIAQEVGRRRAPNPPAKGIANVPKRSVRKSRRPGKGNATQDNEARRKAHGGRCREYHSFIRLLAVLIDFLPGWTAKV